MTNHEAQRVKFARAARKAEEVARAAKKAAEAARVAELQTVAMRSLHALQDEARGLSVGQLRVLLTDRYGVTDPAIRVASAEWLLAEIPRSRRLAQFALADAVAGNNRALRGALASAKAAP